LHVVFLVGATPTLSVNDLNRCRAIFTIFERSSDLTLVGGVV